MNLLVGDRVRDLNRVGEGPATVVEIKPDQPAPCNYSECRGHLVMLDYDGGDYGEGVLLPACSSTLRVVQPPSSGA